MKSYIQSNKKGLIILFMAIVMISVIFTLKGEKSVNYNNDSMELTSAVLLKNIDAQKEISEEEKIELTLNEYIDEINFFADTFQIKRDIFYDLLRKDIDVLENSENIDKTLVDYLFSLEEQSESLFSNKLVSCTDSKDYLLSLIRYYTTIYDNVEFQVAAAIAEIESGYNAPAMLRKNNIFGGMARGTLIQYRNIEYGVLKYIKLLSESYYAKGLTTVEAIGVVYNPIIDESGKKIANPTWIANVKKVLKKYEEFEAINSVSDIISLHEAV